jgi:TPR repeat protein
LIESYNAAATMIDSGISLGLEIMKNLANKKSYAALLFLAIYYSEREPKISLDYYIQSAYQGCATAFFKIGKFFHQGLIVDKNCPIAVLFYAKAISLADKFHPMLGDVHLQMVQIYSDSNSDLYSIEKVQLHVDELTRINSKDTSIAALIIDHSGLYQSDHPDNEAQGIGSRYVLG